MAGDVFRVTGRNMVSPESSEIEIPICYLDRLDLASEMGYFKKWYENAFHAILDFQSASLRTIRRWRACDQFTDRRRDLTAREHEDMMYRERRDAFEAKERRLNWWMRFAELTLVIVGLVLVVVAANIERGGQQPVNIYVNSTPEVPTVVAPSLNSGN